MRKIVFLVGAFFLSILYPHTIRSEALKLNSAKVEVYFSPKSGVGNRIANLIKKACCSVYVAVYSFTNRKIAWAIVDAHRRGVDVKVILDEGQAKVRFGKYEFFRKKGVPVLLDTDGGLMHDKFAIIDNKIVITGSYNWTRNAEHRNRENVIIIYSRSLAEIYTEEFFKLWRRYMRGRNH
jgi:phosphatidylserine/phosphatidylglycerophosphate/cardiolipin synthase-like enzyme